uniref:DNA replication ATP-dependent helicase/nuclease n=1 Tax=Anopheles atroparvus TaxID=41427 RepID=A0AAG5D0B7_ANOAO
MMFEEGNKRKLSSPDENPPGIVKTAAKYPRQCASVSSAHCKQDTNLDKPCDNYADLLQDVDENWSDFDEEKEQLYTLDLTKWQRCKVLTVERSPNQNLLVVLEEKNSKEKAKCSLSSPWNALGHIVPGLTVSVRAVKDAGETGHYTVNCNDGFFVSNPDQLISGTTVVGSLFCLRRGVLQVMFRMIDAENEQMHIGTLAHAIFQQCLVDNNCRTLEHVRRISESWLTSSKLVPTLFAYKMDSAEALQILDPYIKQIAIFLEKHVQNRSTSTSSATGCGKRDEKEMLTIVKVNDIEENIWCHQLGIKGRIDATVSVACESRGSNDAEEQLYEVMPLELKTGRASYSFEHTGQLVLYEMMMNLVGHSVNSGLLVYLREGTVRRMIGNRNTRRDLIMLRNEIAHYVGRWMTPNEGDAINQKNPLPLLPVLPEPINHQRACVKCPYNTVCTVFAKKELNQPVRNETHGLSLIADEASGHLTDRSIDYFILWTGLIYLEREESLKDYSVRNLWTKNPDIRVQRGWCIAGLRLLSTVRIGNENFYHSFSMDPETDRLEDGKTTCKPPSSSKPGAHAGFEVGDYVVCSTENRIAIAAGYIQSFIGCEIIASFERDLSVSYRGEIFLLDRSEPYNSAEFNLSNLAMLLSNTEEANRLRRIIIDRETPTFTDHILKKSQIPVAKKLLEQLNRHQKLATLKAASTDSYCLLKGLPGTGKTQTIVGLIRLLSTLGQSVLLTSNTHSAVDNVLKRLSQHDECQFIRLGSIHRIDPAIRPFAASVLSEGCSTPKQLSELYEKFKIVAVTCQGTSHPLITQRTFDYCIVDEATQVFQSSILRPLLKSKRFLLVGDPEQLPPVVKSNKARAHGATESLFHRLDQPGSYFILPTQYRMNRVLTRLANNFAYDGKLVCGNDLVANATLFLPNLGACRQMFDVERWLMKTISSQLDLSAVLLDTGNTHQLNQKNPLSGTSLREEKVHPNTLTNYKNVSEVALIVYICGALLRAGFESSSIGVMAPFRSQVELIRLYMRKMLQKQRHTQRSVSSTQSLGVPAENVDNASDDSCGVEVNTVDQFQGKDKKLIIYSCTRTLDANVASKVQAEQPGANENEILNDKRRLTVAITRAQEKLILVGDWISLDRYPPFRKLLKVASDDARIELVDSKDGFDWKSMIDALHALNE